MIYLVVRAPWLDMCCVMARAQLTEHKGRGVKTKNSPNRPLSSPTAPSEMVDGPADACMVRRICAQVHDSQHEV